MHGIGSAYEHSLLQRFDYLRGILQGFAQGREHVVDQDDHGLALNHRLAGAADLVVLNVLWGYFFLLVQVCVGWLHVFFEVERLVLQSMGEFVGQHRLLLLGA